MSGVSLDIHSVAAVVEAGLLLWLAALAFFVFFKLMTGEIRLRGLLAGSHDSSQMLPERMVLLAGTLGYAFYYVTTALGMPLDGPHPSLPEVPENVLTLLLGANALYLTTRIVRGQSGRDN